MLGILTSKFRIKRKRTHTQTPLRKARAKRVQSGARQAGRIYHLSGAARWARNLVLGYRSPKALLDRFDWLYGLELGRP